MTELEEVRERVRASVKQRQDLEVVIARYFHFTPPHARLFHLLFKLPAITSEAISERLGIRDVKVAIHRLRREIESGDHAGNVQINSKRGVGYWMDDASKAYVRSVISNEANEAAA